MVLHDGARRRRWTSCARAAGRATAGRPTPAPRPGPAPCRARGAAGGRLRRRPPGASTRRGCAPRCGAARTRAARRCTPRGKVHRDIKPSNVLVTPERARRAPRLRAGRRRRRRARAARRATIVGTVRVHGARAGGLAPGRARGRLVQRRRHALRGADRAAAVQRRRRSRSCIKKQRFEPPAAARARAGRAARISTRCAWTSCASSPRRGRPARDVLAPGARQRVEPHLGVLAARRRARRPSSAATRELATLAAAFAESRRRRAGHACSSHGESGVGKSALVRRFAEGLRARGATRSILRGAATSASRCPTRRSTASIDALSRYLATLRRGRRGGAPAAHAGAARAGLPGAAPASRRSRGAPRPTREVARPAGARARACSRRCASCSARLAERRPLVLVIDDLQWADADSLALLAEMLRAARRAAAAAPGDRAHRRSRRGRRADRAPAPARCAALRAAARLPPDEARALVEAAPGATAARTAPVDAAAIAEEAGGHPLFIDELVRHLLEREAAAAGRACASRTRCGARIAAPRAGRAPTCSSCRASPARRSARRPWRRARRSALAELPRARGPARRANLRAHQRVTRQRRGRDLPRPRARGRAGGARPGGRALACHERLALALEASRESDAEALSVHWRGAGEPEKAGRYATRRRREGRRGAGVRSRGAPLPRGARAREPGAVSPSARRSARSRPSSATRWPTPAAAPRPRRAVPRGGRGHQRGRRARAAAARRRAAPALGPHRRGHDRAQRAWSLRSACASARRSAAGAVARCSCAARACACAGSASSSGTPARSRPRR